MGGEEQIMGIDSKEILEATERFFSHPEYHKKRIENLLEQWDREDREK